MAQWTVHRKPGAPAEDIRLVREGFNGWAFVFPLPWLVIKGMWIVLLIAAAVQMLLWGVGRMIELGDITSLALGLALNLIMGFEGNDLYRWTLARRGLAEVDVVSGDDHTEAEIRYFSRHAPEPETVVEPPPAPVPPPQSRAWQAAEQDVLFPGFGRT